MLNTQAYDNINLILTTAKQIWGENCKFGEMKELPSPYPEFEWELQLYEKFHIKLTYDRSTLNIGIPVDNDYIALNRMTKEPVYWGFDGMKPKNLLHNFQVLDRLLQKDFLQADRVIPNDY